MASSNADFLYTLSARLDGEVSAVFAQFEQAGRQAGARVTESVAGVGRAADQSSEKLRAAAAAARLFEGGIGGAASRLTGLNDLLRSTGILVAGPLALIAGAAAFLNYGSTIQSAEARLRAMTGSQAEFNKAQAAAIEIAKESRSSLTDTIALYSRLATVIPRQGIKLAEIKPVVSAIQTTSAIQGLSGSQESGALTNIAEIFDANAQRIGQQITRLSKDSPLLLQTIVDGLHKIDAVKFDGTVDQFRKLSAAGKTTSADLVHALTAEQGHLQDLLAAGGTTITQAKNAFSTAVAQIIIGVENTTHVLGGAASGIVFLSNHLTELGGVLTVVGATYAASLAAPILLSIPTMVSAAASVARLVLGFNGLGPALLAGGLGASKLSTALGALLSPTNLLVAGLAAAAGVVYFFATRESEAEKASRDLGIAQGELAAKVLATTGRIIAQNGALAQNVTLASARGRADAQDKLNSAKGDEQTARDNLAARLRLLSTPGGEVYGLAGKVDAGLPIQQITAALDVLQQKYPGQFTFLKSFGKDINSVADDLAVATTRVKGIEQAISGAGRTATPGSPTSTLQPKTKAELDAQAQVNAIDAGTSGIRAAGERRRLALAQLDEQFVSKGKVDPAKQDDYLAQKTQIEATYNQEIDAVHSAAAAKRESAKQEREAKAAQAKADREAARLAKQENVDALRDAERIQAFKDRFGDEPSKAVQADKALREQFAIFLKGGQSYADYLGEANLAAQALLKPLREATAQAQLLAATDNLTLTGNSDAAEVLHRAVDLKRQGVELSRADLDTINKQVIADGERSSALAHQNELIDVYARSAGDIQRSFRDLFAGGSLKDFGNSLISNLKNSLADSLSIKIFGNAEQDARDRMTGAIGANTTSLDAVKAALDDYASALRNPAVLGDALSTGLVDAQKTLASSPLAGGAANDNGSLVPNVDNPSVAGAQVGRLLGAGGAIGGLFALFSSSNNRLATSLSGISTALDGGGSGTTNRSLPRGAGANFADNLSRQLGQLGDFFDKKLGKGTATDGVQDAGSGGLGKAGSAVGKFAGNALVGYEQGQQITGILQSIGIGKANTGSKVGGGIGAIAGEASGIPGGAIIGQVLGSLVGSLFGGVTARAFTQLSVDAYGTAIAGAQRARGDKQTENKGSASQEASAFTSALGSLANTFGASLKPGSQLGEIGVYNGQYGFHRQFGDGGGDVQTFGSAQEAVAAAIKFAINSGAVEGLRDGTKRLLTAAGDFTAQTTKAQKFEQVFTDLKAATDPVGAAIDTVNKKFKDLQSIFGEAGASATDYAQLQQLYDLQRADALKTAESKAVSVLQDYLNNLKTNASTGLSARDREAAALAGFNPLADQVTAGKAVDQDKFKAAADTLLAVDRELFGSTNDYFTRLAQITGLTQKAISNATTGATAATSSVLTLDPNAAAKSASAANDNLSSLNDSILSVGNRTNALLQQLIATVANGGGGSGRGFDASFKIANF